MFIVVSVAGILLLGQTPAGPVATVQQTQPPSRQAPKDLSGFYEVMGREGNSAKYVYIAEKRSGDITIRDLNTSAEVHGTKQAGALVFPDSRWEELRFDKYSDRSMTGVTTYASGVKAEIVATKLVSVWSCANHPTAHLAKSEQDMKDHTTKYSCSGWHKVDPPKVP